MTRLPGSAWLEAASRAARQSLWLRGVNDLGPHVSLAGRPFIDNRGWLAIGEGTSLASSPVQSHLVVAEGAELLVGAGCTISFGAAISAGASVRIGAGSRIGPYVVIMDSDFHVAGDRSAHAKPKPITLGEGVVIESRVTILRGSTIGAGARICSGSVVSGDIAAGVVATGVPAGVWSGREAGSEQLDVASVVMLTLNLDSKPRPSDGPDQLAQWDSFGALKLLLALEKAFNVTIREDQIKSARSVADLAQVVEVARLA